MNSFFLPPPALSWSRLQSTTWVQLFPLISGTTSSFSVRLTCLHHVACGRHLSICWWCARIRTSFPQSQVQDRAWPRLLVISLPCFAADPHSDIHLHDLGNSRLASVGQSPRFVSKCQSSRAHWGLCCWKSHLGDHQKTLHSSCESPHDRHLSLKCFT